MPSYRCPKCSSTIDAEPDAHGSVTCGQCGVKLRVRQAAAAPKPAAPAPPSKAASTASSPASAPSPSNAPAPSVSLDDVLREIRAIRDLQEEILDRLRTSPPAGTPAAASAAFGIGFGDDDAPPRPAPSVRSRRRKSVLLIDDDPATSQAAVAGFEAADVPVRTVDDGNAALAAIAEDKPHVIVLELGLGGAMPGKDLVNMIKATMEWVDVPIVLYTRVPVASQKEARTIHGADELVLKASEGPSVLVSRVIAIFRATPK